MSFLIVKDLVKKYKNGENEIEVLKKLNFQMNRGDFISIQGTSGAGKSTFLNLLGALEEPSSGSIQIEESFLSDYAKTKKLNQYRRQFIGYIFQNHYLMYDFTILENVMMPLLVGKTNKKIAKQKAIELLKEVQLDHRLNHLPSQISGGESQRVAVARALVHEPSLILADEPTGNLDSKNTANFIDLLKDLQLRNNLSILMVTHDKGLAKSAKKQMYMEDGQIS